MGPDLEFLFPRIRTWTVSGQAERAWTLEKDLAKSVTIRLATGFFLATGLAYIKKKKIYRRKNNSEFNTKKWTSKMYLLPLKYTTTLVYK